MHFAKILGLCVALAGGLHAQSFAFKVGGGFTSPVGDTTPRLETGWNFSAGAGARFNRWFEALGEFTYNEFGITRASLNELQVPDGNVSVWSITAQPVLHLAPDSPVGAYITGGGGLYRRTVEFTRPTLATVTVFDPFWGFFFPAVVPANVVIGSDSQNEGGVNIGGGLSFRVGRRARLFAEARYHRMYTSPIATEFVPVTFGLRW